MHIKDKVYACQTEEMYFRTAPVKLKEQVRDILKSPWKVEHATDIAVHIYECTGYQLQVQVVQGLLQHYNPKS